MTAPVRITAREQIGDRIVLHTAEGETFDECIEALRKLRAQPVPAPDVTRISVGPDGGTMQGAPA